LSSFGFDQISQILDVIALELPINSWLPFVFAHILPMTNRILTGERNARGAPHASGCDKFDAGMFGRAIEFQAMYSARTRHG
jgi:hypothetical protein